LGLTRLATNETFNKNVKAGYINFIFLQAIILKQYIEQRTHNGNRYIEVTALKLPGVRPSTESYLFYDRNYSVKNDLINHVCNK